jgi:hypothetical protein
MRLRRDLRMRPMPRLTYTTLMLALSVLVFRGWWLA